MAFAAILLTGCKQADITYDHELPQFEVRDGAYLIELIAPTGTAVDDEIYIFGAFNGLDETTAPSHLQWKMEKATESDKKWGIYLFPSDFVAGATLADGFSFVSKKAGGERDINGQPVTHKFDAAIGTRINVWADRWAAYFSGDDEKIEHNGYVIYVLDESGFASLTMYMYGDINDLNGAWPGMKPTGKETVAGVEYTYFDLGEDNTGLSETLIFSDNGSNQLSDYGPIVINDNLFLHIHDGKIEKIDASSTTEHDGAVVYVLDGKNWGMSTTLYMWGDVNDLNGGWPGMNVTGTVSFGDYTYLYYDMGAANEGLNESLIFSNNGATQMGDYPGGDDRWTIGGELFLYIGADGVSVIADPENPGDLVWFDPKAAPKEEARIDFYFYDQTDSLSMWPADSLSHSLHVYAWGSEEVFGAWPGQAFADMDSLSVLGLTLTHTAVDCHVGDALHLIVNNNEGKQLADFDVTVDAVEKEFYLKVTDQGVTPLEVIAKNPNKR